MTESQLQSKIIKWLKDKGCYVIKTTPAPGVPVGIPDVIAFYDGSYLMIEVKASATSRFQPLQKPTLDKMREWSPFIYVAHPKNWATIQADLIDRFF